MRARLVWLSTTALALFLIFSDLSSVFAQESNDEEYTLEEIIVTAEKKAENVQKVPMTMDVITSDEINTQGKSDLAYILSTVSNSIITTADDGLRITLRGITDDSAPMRGQSISTPAVAVNKDGVYTNRKNTGSDLFDIERVEVLYGPQSTLYASNSPGGIVNVVTANPKLDKFEASGQIEYGNYNLLHFQGAVNVPISGQFAMRAAFSKSSHDGYLSNGGMNQDAKDGRLRLLYQPAEKLSIIVTGEIGKQASQMFGSVARFVDQDELDDPWYTTNEMGAPMENTSKRITGTMDWDAGFGTITLVPAYTTQSGSGEQIITFGATTTKNVFDQESKEKTVELRMSSASGAAVKWIVGFNYYKSNDHMAMNSYYLTGEVAQLPNGGDMNETSKAAFGNITYPFTDRFRVTGGIRQSWDHVYNDRTVGPTADHQIFDFKYDKPNYKLGMEYDLTTSSMAYVNYSTGYRMQGMMASPLGGTTYSPPPQKLQSYEIGAKNRFLDNKLQVNGSAFYYNFKNYNASDKVQTYQNIDPETGELYVDDPYFRIIDSTHAEGDLQYTTDDPGEMSWGDGRMYGLDLNITALITPQDNLKLSASYLKSEWTDFGFTYTWHWQFVGMGGPGMGGGATSELVSLQWIDDQDYNGEQMMASPKLTISGTYSHRFNLWNGGNIEAQIQETYKSDVTYTLLERDYPYNYQEPYHNTDFSMTYTHSNGMWTLAAYVRNLENYAAKTGYFGDPIQQTSLSNPRTYGGVLTVRF